MDIRSEFESFLHNLKEEFHRSGRYDDSGIKLDEITKLLFLKAYEEKRGSNGKGDRFNISSLEDISKNNFGSKRKYSKALNILFKNSINSEKFEKEVGSSIFGNRDSLNIKPDENRLAKTIVSNLSDFEILESRDGGESTSVKRDLLNDAFGHFVRDTFRNTKEDAQYMTPPEAVKAMTEIAFNDIAKDKRTMSKIMGDNERGFKLLDPCCGVGSFLASGLRRLNNIIDQNVKEKSRRKKLKKEARENFVWGQDKVDRMVRLSKLNMLLFGGDPKNVRQGNSIIGDSFIDSLDGDVDLIITNPPFKAKFDKNKILNNEWGGNYEILNDIYKSYNSERKIPSEIVLLDRCFSLLDDGGRLLIVLPESIASGKGLEARIRDWVGQEAVLKAVIALPPVTFAQAGTRTRTCILYIQKGSGSEVNDASKIMVGECENIGYEVVQRKGTPKRRETGDSDLISIAGTYSEGDSSTNNGASVVSEEPPITWVSPSQLLNGRWTPSFYSPSRLNSIEYIHERSENGNIDYAKLQEITNFKSKSRQSVSANNNKIRCISVSHVDEKGLIDFSEVENYNPKTDGRVCRTGDVIISRLNPHILRCTVVPDRPYPIICSKEFEIMEASKRIGPYLTSSVIMSRLVKDQIVSLTTGTSSSHSRIKRDDLKEVLIPFPKNKDKREELNTKIRERVNSHYKSYDKVKEMLEVTSSIIDKRQISTSKIDTEQIEMFG